jgi:hypothetical protein
MKPALSARTVLLIIAGMFLMPLVLAWLMYNGTIDFKPASTRNFGRLVEPPVPMSWAGIGMISPGENAAERFDGHWVVLYRVADSCKEDCLEEISGLRQIHKASGRHQPRIRMALLLNESQADIMVNRLQGIYQKFHLIRDPAGILLNALDKAGAGDNAYLIDPLGNIMMAYEAGSDPNHLKQDLKRLLTWSKLDEQ